MPQVFHAGPLRLKYWPFALVPQSGAELVWADRELLKKQITLLGRRLARHQAVSLHLLWADFGAGKTHTLLYIRQEALKGVFGSMLPLYCALPKGCRTFVDIYRAIAQALPAALLLDAYHKAFALAGHEVVVATLGECSPNLLPCLQAIAVGREVQQRIALGWLHGEGGVPASDLRGLSIFGRIRSTDEAVNVLRGLVRLFNLAGYKRVFLMVDEFQRVEALRRQQQDEINAGLHGFYNACGHGMSLLLSFSFGVEENIKHFLNDELLSRVDPIRISIPAMTTADGESFLNDVLQQAREDAEWPVEKGVVPAIVRAVENQLTLTPRRLLKAAGVFFELAAMDLEDGKVQRITEREVGSCIEEGYLSRIDQEEEPG